MKHTLVRITAIAVVLFTLGSCAKKTTSTPAASTTPSFSATMNGTATTFTGSASSGANYFQINGVNTSTYTVELFLYKVSSTGTYSLAANNGSDSYSAISSQSGQSWTSTSGTVTISTYDATNKLVSGTFSITATGSGSMSVTNGSFSNISF